MPNSDKKSPVQGEIETIHSLVYFDEYEVEDTEYSDSTIVKIIDDMILQQSRNKDERELLEMKLGHLSA